MEIKNIFIHHVFFWLKNADSKDDKAKLLEGLQKLSHAKTIKDFHIGEPANTSRGVIENTYNVSWMLFFETAEAEATYQTDPVHLKFVEECSYLWSKVIVYDSENVK